MGGNVFKNQDQQITTQRINQTDVKPTLQWLEQLTGLDLINNTLGTTGLKPTSGDMDVAVDATPEPARVTIPFGIIVPVPRVNLLFAVVPIVLPIWSARNPRMSTPASSTNSRVTWIKKPYL